MPPEIFKKLEVNPLMCVLTDWWCWSICNMLLHVQVSGTQPTSVIFCVAKWLLRASQSDIDRQYDIFFFLFLKATLLVSSVLEYFLVYFWKQNIRGLIWGLLANPPHDFYYCSVLVWLIERRLVWCSKKKITLTCNRYMTLTTVKEVLYWVKSKTLKFLIWRLFVII